MIARCNLCPDPETAFSVPWDFIGKELMDGHRREAHPRAAELLTQVVQRGGPTGKEGQG